MKINTSHYFFHPVLQKIHLYFLDEEKIYSPSLSKELHKNNSQNASSFLKPQKQFVLTKFSIHNFVPNHSHPKSFDSEPHATICLYVNDTKHSLKSILTTKDY